MKWVVALILSLFASGKPADVAPMLVPTPTVEARKNFVLLSVPFTSQAPDGNWRNPKFQDGCEETAALMAILAMRQTTMTKSQYSREIEKIWDWQAENYGSGVDTSAEDTARRILGGYFGYRRYEIGEMRNYKDIIDELAEGRIVIVPVDGRGLNPNYTAPGPERHMILVRGYDDETGEFITNDAGTRRGEKYRYKYQKLFDAVGDYPTGDHEPITERKKVMIVISNSKS